MKALTAEENCGGWCHCRQHQVHAHFSTTHFPIPRKYQRPSVVVCRGAGTGGHKSQQEGQVCHNHGLLERHSQDSINWEQWDKTETCQSNGPLHHHEFTWSSQRAREEAQCLRLPHFLCPVSCFPVCLCCCSLHVEIINNLFKSWHKVEGKKHLGTLIIFCNFNHKMITLTCCPSPFKVSSLQTEIGNKFFKCRSGHCPQGPIALNTVLNGVVNIQLVSKGFECILGREREIIAGLRGRPNPWVQSQQKGAMVRGLVEYAKIA